MAPLRPVLSSAILLPVLVLAAMVTSAEELPGLNEALQRFVPEVKHAAVEPP